MKSLHIRDVRPETIDALKRKARLNHRSLQGELRDILERAARTAPPPDEKARLDIITVDTGNRDGWRRAEIYGDAGR